MTTKDCNNCKYNLPINMFEINKKNNKEYYRNKCKECRLNETQIQRKKIKEKDKIQINNKVCTKCSDKLELSKFHKESLSKDGYNKICKQCLKKNRCKNKQKIISSDISIYCIKCRLTKLNKEFRTNAKSSTGYYKTCNTCWKPVEWNKEKQHAAEKKYITNNPEKIRDKNRRQSKIPQRIIKGRLRSRIKGLLLSKKLRKNNKTIQYIGCDIPYLKKWIEFQFTDDINWNNIGLWHIDHVTPCRSFDLIKEEEQIKCFNWQNLRPCLAIENLEKSCKIIESLIDSHKKLVLKFLEINPLLTHPGNRVEGAE